MHRTISPAIHYFGTPVVLISTLNPDATPNLAPMSSAWWLQDRCVLGLDPTSQTTHNLVRTGQCVLNLPAANQSAWVNRLALTTGSALVPPHKRARGYRHEPHKFEAAGLTPLSSSTVAAPRVLEFPVHLEAELEHAWPMTPKDQPEAAPYSPLALQVRILCVHAEESLLLDGAPNRIDPDRWRPLIMSFQQFYGLGPRAGASRLATVPEELYQPKGTSPAKAGSNAPTSLEAGR